MSTRRSIKWSHSTSPGPEYHLYTDLADDIGDEDTEPVYLRLEDVPFEAAYVGGSSSVTVTLTREMARGLGLLPALEKKTK